MTYGRDKLSKSAFASELKFVFVSCSIFHSGLFQSVSGTTVTSLSIDLKVLGSFLAIENSSSTDCDVSAEKKNGCIWAAVVAQR